MNLPTGPMEKTAIGRQEMAARTLPLDRRARALLIMVDGRTDTDVLVSRAQQIGAQADDLFDLLRSGLIRPVVASADAIRVDASVAQSSGKSSGKGGAARRRSLALARLYLLDIMAQLHCAADHPARARLIGAADCAALDAAFADCLAFMRGKASQAFVANVEQGFRERMPSSDDAIQL